MESMAGTPVMSMTTTLARFARMALQQLFGDLAGALTVEHADDRQDQQLLAHLQHRCGQLPDRLLLLADDPLALLYEADGYGVGNPVGRGLVGIQNPVEQLEVGLILLEQRARKHVAQQQDDTDDLVGLDAAGDDAFGQVARVGLQCFHAAGLEHPDVIVIDGRRLGEDLLRRHRGEQGRSVILRAHFSRSAVLFSPQMLHQLWQQRGVVDPSPARP